MVELELTPSGPMVRGASASMLRELLAELKQQMLAAGVPFERCFNPGLPADEVRRLFAAAGIAVVPDEVAIWFEWANGENFQTRAELRLRPLAHFEGWRLEQVLRSHQSTLQFNEQNAQDPHFELLYWNPAWMRIIGDNWGIGVLFEGEPETPPVCRVFEFSSPNTDPSFTDFQFVSLCTPVALWVQYIRDGVWRWDPDYGGWRGDAPRSPIEAINWIS